MAPLDLKNVKISNSQLHEKREHPAALYASLLDLLALDVYIPFVLFYKPKHEQSDPGNLISHLKDGHQDSDIPMPALFIQATQIKCGGGAQNATFNHETADGHALISLMTAWSQIAMHGEIGLEFAQNLRLPAVN